MLVAMVTVPVVGVTARQISYEMCANFEAFCLSVCLVWPTHSIKWGRHRPPLLHAGSASDQRSEGCGFEAY